MCPNPVPDPETNGSYNHCRYHHLSLSDGKPSFLIPWVCRREASVQFSTLVATVGGKVEADQNQLEELV